MQNRDINHANSAANDDGNGKDGHVVVEPPAIFIRDLIVHAPRAAGHLAALPPEERPAALERIIDIGGEAYEATQGSALVKVLDFRVNDIFTHLGDDLNSKVDLLLAAQRTQDAVERKAAQEALVKLMEAFSQKVARTFDQYCDPHDPAAFPAVMTGKLAEVNKATLQGIEKAVGSGDESLLHQEIDRCVKTLKEEIDLVKAQVVAKNTMATRTPIRGATFEEALGYRLGEVMQPYDADVERCANTTGTTRQRHGDLVVTVRGLTAGNGEIRVVVEAKSRATGVFKIPDIRGACRDACGNRDADVALFITDCAAVLPEGRGFGRVDGHFFLAVPDDADNIALASTIHLAIMQVAAVHATANINVAALEAEARGLRSQVEELSEIDASSYGAIKLMQKVVGKSTSLKGAMLQSISRIETLLTE
jgi:hypothetical protein